MNTIYYKLKLDREIPVPLYYQLKQFMIEQIEKGVLAEGDPVPSEEELCTILNVSRATIRQAFSELVNEGRLRRQKAKGTFIAKPRIQGSFFQTLSSFNAEMEAKGLVPSTKVMEIRVTKNQEIAEKLALRPATPIIYIKRLRCANDQPMVFVETYLSFEKYARLLDEDLEKDSLYKLLEKKYNTPVYKASRILHVELATGALARLLEIENGSPIYTVSTASYTKDERPVAYSISKYRGDLNEFRVDLYREHGAEI